MSIADLYEFRPLRRSDYASYRSVVLLAVGRLETATGLDASAEATIDQLSRRSIWFLLRLFRLFGRPVADILVATDGREVVGTGTILWLPRTAYVAGMATRPSLRGRGIASRILTLQADRARRRHRAWLALDVESENETALRVYRNSGYREVGTFTWFIHPGPPPSGPSPPTGVPVGASDWAELATRLDASRPADYRAAFPAGERVLSHNEYQVRSGRAPHRTWKKEFVGGAVGAVRAYFLPGARMGVYFPMTTLPEPPAEEFVGLIDAATEWLGPLGPSRVLAVAPEPHGSIAGALERRGFLGVVSSTVMVRPTPE